METETRKRLLTPAEAAERLGTTPGTLAVWRATNRYSIPYVKVGRAVRYQAEDVEAWIASRTVRPQEGE